MRTTSVGMGPNAIWNEELILPIKMPGNDFSPGSLQRCPDHVYFNLFDELVVDIAADQPGNNVHHRTIKRWLGSTSIPFSTVYQNARVHGTFKIDVPIMLLGYVRDSPFTGINTDGTGQLLPVGERITVESYLSVFLTINPPFRVLPVELIMNEHLETPSLVFYAKQWVLTHTKLFPTRLFHVLVNNIHGKTLLCTRFIRGQPPPVLQLGEIAGNECTPLRQRRLARFVASIPFLLDSVTFNSHVDFWASSHEFLEMIAGDTEEHSILLCNFMLTLPGVEAWVVIGEAIPEGGTSYVLTKYCDSFALWDATKGEEYCVADSFCPLHSVNLIFNDVNAWANIGPYQNPCRVNFNLSNTKWWTPFFTSGFPNPDLPSVQAAVLRYTPADPVKASVLQETIEARLVHAFEAWRPVQVTRWHRHTSQVHFYDDVIILFTMTSLTLLYIADSLLR